MNGSIQLAASLLADIARAGKAAWPREACGILMGERAPGAICVRGVIATANESATPENHYVIDPLAILAAERGSGRAGEVVGFYHSHPGGRAEPSARDLAEAWEIYVYAIYSVSDGVVRAWRLPARGRAFEELTIITT